MREQYEFTGDQNATVSALSGKMGLVGVFLILLGVVVASASILGFMSTLGTVPEVPQFSERATKAVEAFMVFAGEQQRAVYYGSLAGFLQAMILIIGGFYMHRSAGAFRKIVDTEGRDISHLLNALRSLTKLFGILSTLLVLAFLLAVVAVGVRLYFGG